MKLSTPLMYDGQPARGRRPGRRAREGGARPVWVAEAYGFDSPTLMGYLAAKTETVEIGAGILNVYSRTPGALLQTAAGLDNVSGGRAVDRPRRLRPAGDRGLPRPAVRQAARPHPRGHRDPAPGPAPRAARARGRSSPCRCPADQGLGLGKPLKILTKPERASVPIWVAVARRQERRDDRRGRRRLAAPPLPTRRRPTGLGRRARRGHRQALRRPRPARDHRRRHGRDRRGRGDQGAARLRPPDVRAVRRRHGRPRQELLQRRSPASYGYEKEAKEIQDLYLDGKKDEAEALVPTEWLEAGNLVGPASYVKERIAAFREAGVTNLQITPASDDPVATVAQIKEWVS